MRDEKDIIAAARELVKNREHERQLRQAAEQARSYYESKVAQNGREAEAFKKLATVGRLKRVRAIQVDSWCVIVEHVKDEDVKISIFDHEGHEL